MPSEIAELAKLDIIPVKFRIVGPRNVAIVSHLYEWTPEGNKNEFIVEFDGVYDREEWRSDFYAYHRNPDIDLHEHQHNWLNYVAIEILGIVGISSENSRNDYIWKQRVNWVVENLKPLLKLS